MTVKWENREFLLLATVIVPEGEVSVMRSVDYADREPPAATVNWSAHGSREVGHARAYAEAILEGCRIAEEMNEKIYRLEVQVAFGSPEARVERRAKIWATRVEQVTASIREMVIRSGVVARIEKIVDLDSGEELKPSEGVEV